MANRGREEDEGRWRYGGGVGGSDGGGSIEG